MSFGAIQPRSVSLTISSACKATVVPGGSGGYAEQFPRPVAGAAGAGGTVSLTLSGGGGALLKLEAATAGAGDTAATADRCGDALRRSRDWWFNPRAINLRHAYPELSVKSTTYDAWGSDARHTNPVSHSDELK